MRKNYFVQNEGFTLVELVVTLAIMAIAGTAITSFILVTQKNYNSKAADTQLQTEAQQLVNQLQDLMIDTARGVSYSYVQELADGSLSGDEYLKDDSEINMGDVVTTKTLYIYNVETYYRLDWQPESRQVLYSEFRAADDSVIARDEVLAQFVKSFSIDLRDVPQNRTVKYTITIEKGGTGKHYTTSHKIKLRNEILVNASKNEVYSPDGEQEAVAEYIKLSPSELLQWPGEEVQIYAFVGGRNGAVVLNQKVDWTLEQQTSSGTEVNPATNRLTLGDDEKGTDAGHEFYVKASQGSLWSENEITVKVRSITGITAADNIGNSSGTVVNKLGRGASEVMVTADIQGYHLDDLGNNVEKGGTVITVTEGREYIEIESQQDDKGILVFKVRQNINFNTTPKPRVTIRFETARDGYEGFSCEIAYEIENSNDDMELEAGNWRRNETIDIMLKNIPDDLWYTDSKGEVWLKYDNVIYATYYFYSYYNDYALQPWQFSNQGTFGDSQDQGPYCPVKLSFEKGNFFSLNATYKNVLENFSYSSPYSLGTQWYWAGADLERISMEVWIPTKDGKVSATTVFDIEDVVFHYRNSHPGDEDGRYIGDGETYIVYVTDKDATDTYRSYFKLTHGWDPTNNDYILMNSRYVGKVSDNTRHDLKVESSGSKGVCTVDFTITKEEKSLYKNKVIQEIYEYNPLYGKAGYGTPELKKRYEQIDGCEGIIEFHFKDANILLEDNELSDDKSPSVMYCPRVEELGSEAPYYYVCENERFYVYQKGGKEKAEYQILKGNVWKTQWKKTYSIKYGQWMKEKSTGTDD